MTIHGFQLRLAGLILLCALQATALGEDFCLDIYRPACGKVCKLVCEKKKLTAVGYGNESKQICIPEPSREGCKHCAVCYGKPDPKSCENHAAKCEFCWRNWFACGCAQPRTVRILTKYQAEKQICWYHWEVVDAQCCDCTTQSAASDQSGEVKRTVATRGGRSIFKPAPENTQVGDRLVVTNDDWVKVAALLTPDPTETVDGSDANAPVEKAGDIASGDNSKSDAESSKPSVAERVQRILTK